MTNVYFDLSREFVKFATLDGQQSVKIEGKHIAEL